MAVPDYLANRYVYHFSHIDNLPNILRHGFLANNHSSFPVNGHRSIAAADIQRRRARMLVPCGPGGCVHDYVPLYFGSRSLMLLGVINAKNVDQRDILYFEFPISLVTRPDVVFTNASANTDVAPNFYNNPADLSKLDWEAIDLLTWSEPDDAKRHRRMAELLVHGRLAVTDATRCVVWNANARERVLAIVGNKPFPSIEYESSGRRHWFTAFMNNSAASVVVGPREIAEIFQSTCDAIQEESEKVSDDALFEDLDDLLSGLRKDFGCLTHTAELIGLQSANGLHKKTVDIHTFEVVSRLRSLPEFLRLEAGLKDLVEIAAYLHDIGKGPRSRWEWNGGLQKVDPNHPVGAMPMVVDILTKHVAYVNQEDAEAIAKLVCYHDLVGDVLGRGRDERQIIEVCDGDEDDLDMLFALGRADAMALVETWWDEKAAEALYARCRAAIL